MVEFDRITLTDADWPDHFPVVGRDIAIAEAKDGRFTTYDVRVLTPVLQDLSRPASEWPDHKRGVIALACVRRKVDVMTLFAFCALLVKSRASVRASAPPKAPPLPKPAAPMVIVVQNGDCDCTITVMPHPVHGRPVVSDRDEDGYWSFSAGGIVWVRNRVSLADGARLWNELVDRARWVK